MSTEDDAGPEKYGLTEKNLYEELTYKQQSVVDAIAESPDASNAEIAEEADVTGVYVGMVRDSYPEIIEEREAVANNSHATVEKGNVRVEGEIDFSDLPKEQTIDERPVKRTEARIDDFLPAPTCERLERIADDIAPSWLDRRPTVEETIRALADDYTLSEDGW